MRVVVAICVVATVAAVTEASADSNARVEQFVEASIQLQTLPTSLTPALTSLVTADQIKDAQGSSWIKLSCSPQLTPSVAVHPVPCWYGDPHGVKTVVLYGDSNAGNWIPTMSAVMKLLKYRLAVFAYPSCATPFIPETKTGTGYYPIPFEGVVYGPLWQQCAEWHASVGAAVATLDPSAVIAVSGPWMYSTHAADESAWVNGFDAMFKAMTKGHSATKRILIGSSPLMPDDVPICLSEHATSIQDCAETYTYGTGYYGGILARDASIAKATKATLVPVTSMFCYDNHCSPVVKNFVVYVDEDHTTIAYSTYLDGLLYTDLQPLLK